ncbi:MAG: glycosyl transferase family 1 [Sphingobacteriales bacterium]|nr:glycosyl transferase family 1 [Sphingobacteriales bacterium]
MKIVIAHPTGNANVRAATVGLMEAELLAQFYTSIASFPGSFLDYLSKFKPFSEINRRTFHRDLQSKTSMLPWFEIARLLSIKFKINGLLKHEEGVFCIDSIYKNLDWKVASILKKASKSNASAVYSYEDGAYHSFLKAKSLGLSCYYDLPIGYWRAAQNLLKNEQERWPDWVSTLTGFQDSELKLFRKDEELRMADRIFVASNFTAQTLKEYPGKLAPIEVIPYGFSPINTEPKYDAYDGTKPLKLLFVGSLTQRKGIAELFAVADQLGKHIDLTIVGRKTSNTCIALDKALAKHKWIPSLSHQDVLALMRQSDVLVFPTLFEGFGLVITEAMSQGIPVITTERTIGPDFIRNNENGWIIQAGSIESLKVAIVNLLQTPKLVNQVGIAAIETASLRPWSVYGKELAMAIGKQDSTLIF